MSPSIYTTHINDLVVFHCTSFRSPSVNLYLVFPSKFSHYNGQQASSHTSICVSGGCFKSPRSRILGQEMKHLKI